MIWVWVFREDAGEKAKNGQLVGKEGNARVDNENTSWLCGCLQDPEASNLQEVSILTY